MPLSLPLTSQYDDDRRRHHRRRSAIDENDNNDDDDDDIIAIPKKFGQRYFDDVRCYCLCCSRYLKGGCNSRKTMLLVLLLVANAFYRDYRYFQQYFLTMKVIGNHNNNHSHHNYYSYHNDDNNNSNNAITIKNEHSNSRDDNNNNENDNYDDNDTNNNDNDNYADNDDHIVIVASTNHTTTTMSSAATLPQQPLHSNVSSTSSTNLVSKFKADQRPVQLSSTSTKASSPSSTTTLITQFITDDKNNSNNATTIINEHSNSRDDDNNNINNTKKNKQENRSSANSSISHHRQQQDKYKYNDTGSDASMTIVTATDHNTTTMSSSSTATLPQQPLLSNASSTSSSMKNRSSTLSSKFRSEQQSELLLSTPPTKAPSSSLYTPPSKATLIKQLNTDVSVWQLSLSGQSSSADDLNNNTNKNTNNNRSSNTSRSSAPPIEKNILTASESTTITNAIITEPNKTASSPWIEVPYRPKEYAVVFYLDVLTGLSSSSYSYRTMLYHICLQTYLMRLSSQYYHDRIRFDVIVIIHRRRTSSGNKDGMPTYDIRLLENMNIIYRYLDSHDDGAENNNNSDDEDSLLKMMNQMKQYQRLLFIHHPERIMLFTDLNHIYDVSMYRPNRTIIVSNDKNKKNNNKRSKKKRLMQLHVTTEDDNITMFVFRPGNIASSSSSSSSKFSRQHRLRTLSDEKILQLHQRMILENVTMTIRDHSDPNDDNSDDTYNHPRCSIMMIANITTTATTAHDDHDCDGTSPYYYDWRRRDNNTDSMASIMMNDPWNIHHRPLDDVIQDYIQQYQTITDHNGIMTNDIMNHFLLQFYHYDIIQNRNNDWWFVLLAITNHKYDLHINITNWDNLVHTITATDANKTDVLMNEKNHGEDDDDRHVSMKFAYTFVLGGCDPDDPKYRNYFYSIILSLYMQHKHMNFTIFPNITDLVNPHRQMVLPNQTTIHYTVDTIVLIQMSYQSKYDTLPEEDVQLLHRMNIHIHYIPQTMEESFYRIMLDKMRILQFTNYDRVFFLDADVMLLDSLDYLMILSVQNILRPNIVFPGGASPANGGAFLLQPEEGDYEHLIHIIAQKEAYGKTLPYPHWDDIRGWGHIIHPNDAFYHLNTEEKYYKLNEELYQPEPKWNFYGAFADQGLLYYWVRYIKKDVTIVYTEKIVNLIEKTIDDTDPDHKTFNNNYKNTTNSVHYRIIHDNYTKTTRIIEETEYKTATFFQNYTNPKPPTKCFPKLLPNPLCLPPRREFVHFVGKFKPWRLRHLTKNYTENPLESGVHYWWYILDEINQRYSMNIDLLEDTNVNQNKTVGWSETTTTTTTTTNGTPPLGWGPSQEQANRVTYRKNPI